jgi:inosine-uridine nucleoside N-ribohydrolase
MERIPVILDTDIGGDIDDTWALGFLLRCPELDLRLVSVDTGNTTYRAKIVAKFLERAGRSDIPVAVGLRRSDEEQGQAAWVRDYDLSRYPGTVHEDGVGALVDTIMGSEKPVTLICIGPMPNIREALKREPRIAERTRFVGMHGSLRYGVLGAEGAVPECNVVSDVAAAQAVFTAPWIDMTVTPLDTCGRVQLKGEDYLRIRDSQETIPRLIMENYRIWAGVHQWTNPDIESSVLFDTVAVHLAFSMDRLVMRETGIRVTDDGFTVEDPSARPLHCAVEWGDLAGYEAYLVDRLTTT